MKDRKTCADCAAFDADALICRRNPPTEKGWPSTSETDWCLGHKTQATTTEESALKQIGWDAELFGPLTELLDWLGEGKTVPEMGEYLGLIDSQQVPLALALEKLRDIGIVRQKKWKITRASTETDEPEPPRYRPVVKPEARRMFTVQEFSSQFPLGIKAAQPLPIIREKAVHVLGIPEAQFDKDTLAFLTHGLINKVTLPNGQDRFYR